MLSMMLGQGGFKDAHLCSHGVGIRVRISNCRMSGTDVLALSCIVDCAAASK